MAKFRTKHIERNRTVGGGAVSILWEQRLDIRITLTKLNNKIQQYTNRKRGNNHQAFGGMHVLSYFNT